MTARQLAASSSFILLRESYSFREMYTLVAFFTMLPINCYILTPTTHLNDFDASITSEAQPGRQDILYCVFKISSTIHSESYLSKPGLAVYDFCLTCISSACGSTEGSRFDSGGL